MTSDQYLDIKNRFDEAIKTFRPTFGNQKDIQLLCLIKNIKTKKIVKKSELGKSYEDNAYKMGKIINMLKI